MSAIEHRGRAVPAYERFTRDGQRMVSAQEMTAHRRPGDVVKRVVLWLKDSVFLGVGEVDDEVMLIGAAVKGGIGLPPDKLYNYWYYMPEWIERLVRSNEAGFQAAMEEALQTEREALELFRRNHVEP